jgi:hypothetical protein
MALNPLSPVTDYQSMLNRICWFTSASTLVAVWMLRLYIPGLDAWLSKIDLTFEFGGKNVFPVPGGYLFPALALGILTRIYRVHARISEWLGIRECFDVDVVIGEFATQLDVDLSAVPKDQLREQRHMIMRRAFYPYVGGSQQHIDQYLIQQALDAWSWFWIGIEATLVFLLTGLGLIAAGVYEVGFQTVGGTLLLAAIGLPAMRGQCRRYAIAQVRAIVDDPVRATAVRTVLVELVGGRFAGRYAA